jgi:AraC family transcriptional regulator
MAFADGLVGVAARQLIDELQKGPAADEGFMERLAAIMLEQAFRALTTPAAGGINPRHIHYARLQAVLNHIHSRLADDLSAAALAARAGVSPGYFRRVFQDATGMPPHRYVLAARLEYARKLLTLSEMPIPRIAQDCGFASQSHLTARFREAHAITPAQLRSKAGRGRDGTGARG